MLSLYGILLLLFRLYLHFLIGIEIQKKIFKQNGKQRFVKRGYRRRKTR
jgi:hypothetical protein